MLHENAYYVNIYILKTKSMAISFLYNHVSVHGAPLLLFFRSNDYLKIIVPTRFETSTVSKHLIELNVNLVFISPQCDA